MIFIISGTALNARPCAFGVVATNAPTQPNAQRTAMLQSSQFTVMGYPTMCEEASSP